MIQLSPWPSRLLNEGADHIREKIQHKFVLTTQKTTVHLEAPKHRYTQRPGDKDQPITVSPSSSNNSLTSESPSSGSALVASIF